jgi:hypothetical protein
MWTVILVTMAFQAGHPPEVMSTEVLHAYQYASKPACEKDMQALNVASDITVTRGPYTVTTQGFCTKILRRK